MARGLGLSQVFKMAIKPALKLACTSVVIDLGSSRINAIFSIRRHGLHFLIGRPVRYRAKRYSRGGVVVLSPQTFVVDMLNGVIKADSIHAVYVDEFEKADEVLEFALCVTRRMSPSAHIKAYTDKPISFLTADPFLISPIFRSIFVRSALLYPRFHDTVKGSLKSNVEVVNYSISNPFAEIELLVSQAKSYVRSSISQDGFAPASSKRVKKMNLFCGLLDVLVEVLFSASVDLFIIILKSLIQDDAVFDIPVMSVMLDKAISLSEKMKSKLHSKGVPRTSVRVSLHSVSDCSGPFDSIPSEAYVDMLTSPKLVKLIDILKDVNDALILCSNGVVAEVVRSFLPKHFRVATHGEFELSSTKESASTFFMLNPDLGSFRKVELIVSASSRKSDSPKFAVFSLFFKGSFEERIHLLEMRREKEAFEKMISDKSSGGILFEDQCDDDFIEISVDSREMRSSLPFALYRMNFRLKIKVLEIGDYHIKQYCVERKSVHDLVESVKDGRLYRQLRSMTFCCPKPIYLIEIPPDLSAFHPTFNLLHPIVNISLHFGDVCVIWSCSNGSTARIFRMMAEIPLNGCEHKEDGGSLYRNRNVNLCKILSNIDGISVRNIDSLKHGKVLGCSNIEELAKIEERVLKFSFGEEAGSKMFNFFNRRFSKAALK